MGNSIHCIKSVDIPGVIDYINRYTRSELRDFVVPNSAEIKNIENYDKMRDAFDEMDYSHFTINFTIKLVPATRYSKTNPVLEYGYTYTKDGFLYLDTSIKVILGKPDLVVRYPEKFSEFADIAYHRLECFLFKGDRIQGNHFYKKNGDLCFCYELEEEDCHVCESEKHDLGRLREFKFCFDVVGAEDYMTELREWYNKELDNQKFRNNFNFNYNESALDDHASSRCPYCHESPCHCSDPLPF